VPFPHHAYKLVTERHRWDTWPVMPDIVDAANMTDPVVFSTKLGLSCTFSVIIYPCMICDECTQVPYALQGCQGPQHQ
jgi:hypothetical protein